MKFMCFFSYIRLPLCVLVVFSFLFVSFQKPENTGLPQKKFSDCDSIPELNISIVWFVNSKMDKRVGRGECWDLAAEALNINGAKWDGKYNFGRKVNYDKECVFPGDIIQFEGVKIKYEKNGVRYQEKMLHHTAIIFRVNGKGNYALAHQNTGFSGKKVGVSDLELKNIYKGRFTIFRPVK